MECKNLERYQKESKYNMKTVEFENKEKIKQLNQKLIHTEMQIQKLKADRTDLNEEIMQVRKEND